MACGACGGASEIGLVVAQYATLSIVSQPRNQEVGSSDTSPEIHEQKIGSSILLYIIPYIDNIMYRVSRILYRMH